MEGKWKPEEKRVSSLTALSLLLEYTSGTTLLGWKLSFSFSNELTRCSLFPLILRFVFMSFCLYLSVSLSLSLSPSVSVLCCFLSTTTNGRRKWKRLESRSRKKHRFHCFAAQDTRRRSKTVITQEDVTNGEVRSSPSRAFSLLALFFFCALVRRGYSRATPCFLFSVLIHEHQEV